MKLLPAFLLILTLFPGVAKASDAITVSPTGINDQVAINEALEAVPLQKISAKDIIRFRCKNNFTAFLGYIYCFLYHY